MKLKSLAKILIIGGFFVTLTCSNIVQAGFGVSPPKVLNHHLLPGSHFEQTIQLVQSKPENDLLTTVEIDAPEVKDWLSIDRGLEFIIPRGVKMFPVKITVDVPQDAEFKHYGGRVWIRTTAAEVEGKEGMVSIALGAVIDIDLAVSAEEVHGFIFRGLQILKAEEGRPIKVKISLENTGNVKNRPSKIHLDIYDRYHNELLYSGDATDLGYIKPFTTGGIISKFRAKLSIGDYWAEVKVYVENDILMEDKRIFQVVERTSFFYKIFSQWYSWVILWVVILTVLGWSKRKKLKELISRWNSRMKERRKERLEKKLKKLSK